MSPPPIFEHRQHRITDKIGVALRVIFIFGRDGVRAEKRDGEIEWELVVEGEQGFEETQLGGGLQTITGFGLQKIGRAHVCTPVTPRSTLFPYTTLFRSHQSLSIGNIVSQTRSV